MAYNLTLTNGTALITLADGAVDISTTSINLIGKNYAGYGLLINQNFIKMLENFSKTTAPTNPLKGQLWWDSFNNILKVYVNSTVGWKPMSFSQSATSAPLNPAVGDIWWDSINSLLKIYSGTSNGWLAIGPASSLASLPTAITGNVLVDNTATNHTVGNLMVNNKLTGILSSDSSAFSLAGGATIGGLSTINPGLNFTATSEPSMISSPKFKLGVASGNVVMSSLGAANGIRFVVSPTSVTSLDVIKINGTSGLIEVAGNPTTSLGVSTKGYTDAAIVTANTAMKSYVDDSNIRQTTYTSSLVTTANTNMKAYVDTQVAAGGAGITTITLASTNTGLTINGGSTATINNPVGGTFTIAGTLQADNGGTGIGSYTTGDILYSGSTGTPTALTALAIGTNGHVLRSTGSAPSWVAQSSLAAGSATNLAGGASNALPYQSGSGATSFLSIGTTGQVLTVSAGGSLVWTTQSSAAVTLSDDTSTASAMYPLFWNTTTGTTSTLKTSSSKLTYNPGTGVLTATGFSGSGASLTSIPAAQITGTLPSGVLGTSAVFIGTTSIALNRSSSSQSLTGVSIDGSAGSATTATTATNLAGGGANRIPYQTGTGATSFLVPGTSGLVLLSQGSSSAPTWGSAGVSAGGTGSTSVGAAGTIAYSTGSVYSFTSSAGSSGQVLTSQGGSAPTWTNPAAGTVTSVSISVPTFLTVSVTNSTTTPAITIGYSGSALPVSQGGTGSTTLASFVTTSGTQTITGAKTFAAAVTLNSTVAFTGTTTAVTQTSSDSSTKVATTAFVQAVAKSAGFNNIEAKTASGSWTVPPDVTRFKVTVTGGGGGGRGSSGSQNAAGGSAGTVIKIYTADDGVTPGTTYSYTVGAGGASTTSGTGVTGGASSFVGPTTVTAAGGGGGSANNGGSPGGATGGFNLAGLEGTWASGPGWTPSYWGGGYGVGKVDSTGGGGIIVIEY
jgi:hypothetical protein